MTECSNVDTRDLLPLLAAGRLADADRAPLEAHLASCEACREELALLRQVRVVTSRAPSVDVARIAAAVAAGARPSRIPSMTRPPARRRWRVPAAVAAAAVVGLLSYATVERRDAGVDVAVTAAADSARPRDGAEPAPAGDAVGLSFGGGVADLDVAELGQLAASLDELDPLPNAEPQIVLPHIPIDLGEGS